MNQSSFAELMEAALNAERRGKFDDATRILTSVLESVDGEPSIDIRLRLGKTGIKSGGVFLDDAEQQLEKARVQSEAMGATLQNAEAVHLLALIERSRGNLKAAKTLLEQSPVPRLQSAPGPETAQYYHIRGLLAASAGDSINAERLFFRAIQVFEEIGYEPGLGEVYDSLAGVLFGRGKTKSALKFCERSLEIKRKFKDRYGEAISFGTMGRIYFVQGRFKDAAACFQADLDIARDLNDLHGIGIMLNSLGEVAFSLHNFDDAIGFFQRSTHENSEPGNVAHSHLGVAKSLFSQDKLEAASQEANKVAQILPALGNDSYLQILLDATRAAILWRSGQTEIGRQKLLTAIDHLKGKNLNLDSLPWLYELRDLYQSQNNLADAVTVMSEALELLSICGSERGVKDVEIWLRTVDEPILTRRAMEKHFPKHLVPGILSGELSMPKPHRQRLTILFCDLRDFTTLTESLPPEEMVELMNEWFTEATLAIQKNKGVVEKFIGDAVMAIFGVPEESDDASANAVRAALDMRDSMAAMNLRQQALGGPKLRIGIGIDCGEAVLGFMGSHIRQNYTALGDCVNTSARLESKTKEFPGCDILVSQAVEELQNKFQVAESKFLGNVDLKGKLKKVAVYQIRGRKNVGKTNAAREVQ